MASPAWPVRLLVLPLLLVACQSAPAGPSATPAASGPGSPAPSLPAPSFVPVGRLVEVAPMSIARAVHTQTELTDGRVLIVGGCTNAGCDTGSPGGATAEVFDPARRTFTATGSLHTSRDDHAAVRLADGRVLIAGGWGARGVLDSTEIYDPATGSFSDGPTMSSPRAGFAAIELIDGRILLAGGFTGNHATTATADLFDPETNRILAASPLAEARGSYAAARLADGRVIVVGGYDDGRALASAEAFDPDSAAFSPAGSMTRARLKFAAAPLLDGSVIVMGGADEIEGRNAMATTEIYDPSTGRFRAGPLMRQPRYKLLGSTVILPDGRVFVAGGASRPEILAAAGDAFQSISGSLAGPRLFPAAAAAGGGSVLVTGGYDERIVPSPEAWIYAPEP